MKRLRLVSERILKSFANVVYANQSRVHRLWLVSPWIGAEEDGEDALLMLIDAVRNRPCIVILITRPPEAVWHAQAVELLKANSKAMVYLSPFLHTKLYIVECNGFRCALLGSPNLTPRGDRRNREIAVEFRTTIESPEDEVAAILTELTEYASLLRGETGVSLM